MLGQDGFDLLWGHLGAKAFDHLPLVAHQELREVPGDVFVALFVGVARLEELVEVTGAVAVHLDLGEEREADAELRGCELLDLLVAAGLLRAELVAGKTEDRQTLVVLVKGTQTCVVGSGPSLTGQVDHQAALVPILRRRHRCTVDRLRLEVVEARHGKPSRSVDVWLDSTGLRAVREVDRTRPR